MSKNVLIYFKENSLKPVGGPAGYLYNLQAGFNTCYEQLEEKELSIYFKKEENETSGYQSFILEVLKKFRLPSFCVEVYRAIRRYKRIKDILLAKNRVDTLSRYDAVHFHNTKDMYFERDILKNYKGKVILNSHSPEPTFLEMISEASWLEKKIFRNTYRKLERIDRYAFNRADYIFFPCMTADEPYEHLWDEYLYIKEKKKSFFRYILTGTLPATADIGRKEFRTMYNIPQDAFCISYVGRHSEIKGYDVLKDVGSRLLEQFPNLYILVVGKEYPLSRLKHSRWIEFGWSNNPHSITSASDIFVLPNKETYFDLVLLEVLSLGIPVIASRTGGNKFFENVEGIQLYDDVDSFSNLIRQALEEDKYVREHKMNANKKLYQDKFTVELFAQRYIEALMDVL